MSDQTPIFEARDLRVAIEGKEILRGVDLTIERGKVHALMGRNGSGKSTLAYVALGHPSYEVLGGQIFFNGQDVTELDTDERARAGMFLAFQYPMAIPGVTVSKFMHSALKARAEGGNVQLRESISADTSMMKSLQHNVLRVIRLRLNRTKSRLTEYIERETSGITTRTAT